MVVKRLCSFCAGEVEPGTGTMYVKRDGTVFYFCSSSCRKQQLHLGRVGHRLKWTRAHAVKRAQAQSTAQRGARRSPAPGSGPAKPAAPAPAAGPTPEPPAPAAPASGTTPSGKAPGRSRRPAAKPSAP
jgi:large subunit ribosomal protein L24e